ncbi:MAG: hypothetical protein ACERKV_07245 [Clostridiaceae bacterium]
MNKQELINKTEKYIMDIPEIKNRIIEINNKINNNKIISKDELGMLKKEERYLQIKIEKIRNAMDILDEKEQKIICYRFFENMSFSSISSNLGYKGSYCGNKKLNNLLLKTGGYIFIGDIMLEGLED